MKKLISLVLGLGLALSPLTSGATYLYTESIAEQVTGGVKYEQKNILTENGWIRAYIAYVDLSNPNASIKVLTASKGSSYLENVKSMAENSGACIAVNGDFFNFSGGQTNMLGMVYQNGELVSTPALDNQASFVLTEDNSVIMDYFTFESKVISPQGYEQPIYQINKVPVSTGGITMLTSAWANTTWGNNLQELVVENDIVKEIRPAGSAPGAMPQNGYVLVTNPEINGYFNNFTVGSQVRVETKLTPDITNIKEATGGNTLLVENGQIANFTGNVTGYAQRSSVGISQNGKELILAVTDGRQKECRGLTQKEMAELMISLGAYKAINLDGGGSSTFIKRDSTGYYEAQNSVSSLRSVSTAIGVIDNKLKGSKAGSGILKASKDNILLGDSISLSAEFFDEYGNAFDTSAMQTGYFDSSWNSIDPSAFVPQYTGAHTLYATCGDAVCQTNINVTDNINSIDITNGDSVDIASGTALQLSVHAFDIAGRKVIANPNLITWESDNPAVSVYAGNVQVQGEAGAVVSATYNGKTDYICINKKIYGKKAPLAVTAPDGLYGKIDGATAVAISGNIPKAETLLNRYYSLERLKRLALYDKSYVTSNYYSGSQSQKTLLPKGYTVYNKDNTTISTIYTSEGYVKTMQEWIDLSIASRGTAKNLIIITEKAPGELPENEEKMIKSLLFNAASYGKNVFYVYSGSRPEVHIENGIRYISVGNVAEYRTASRYDDARYCSYVVFYISGNEIRYEMIA